MHLRQLLRNPLGDLGYVVDQHIFFSDSTAPTQGTRQQFVDDVRTAYHSMKDHLGGIPDEAQLAFMSLLGTGEQIMLIDLKKGNNFGRLVYRNGIRGLSLRFQNIPGFDSPALQYTKLQNNVEVPSIGVSRLFSDLDDLGIQASWANNSFTVHLSIKKMRLDSAILNDRESPISPEDLVTRQDLVTSVRAGALLALVGANLVPGNGLPKFNLSIHSSTSGHNSDSGGGISIVTGNPRAMIDGSTSSTSSANSVSTAVGSVTSPADQLSLMSLDLFNLPKGLEDLDFNRFFYKTQTILDLDVVGRAFALANDELQGADFARLSDAFQQAKLNDRDAMGFLDGFINQGLDQKFSTTLIRTMDSETRIGTTTPTTFYAGMVDKMKEKAIAKHIEKTKRDLQGFNLPSPPIDHFTLVWSEQQHKKKMQFHALNPFQLAGSAHARALALFAESGIRYAIGKEKWRAATYLPGLRRFQEDQLKKFREAFKRSVAADSPLSAATVQYAMGMMNLASDTDITDYRLGVFAGQVQGAVMIYDQFRTSLAAKFDLPILPQNATIDEILNYVNSTSQKIVGTIDQLNKVLIEAEHTIRDLRGQLQQISDAWGKAGRGVGVLAYAGAGFLVGGPLGALVGGIVGGLFG